MKFILVTLSILFWFLFSGCSSKRFSLKIETIAMTAGYQVYYTIDEKHLKIQTDCDFEGCEKKTVFSRDLRSAEGDSLAGFIESLGLDNLKPVYDTPGILDGFGIIVKISGKNVKSKTIQINNYHLQVIDSLLVEMDRHIPLKKFKSHSFGEE